MGLLHSSFGAWEARTLEGRLLPVVFACNRGGTKSGNAHELRSSAHEMRQPWRPNETERAGDPPRPALAGRGLGGCLRIGTRGESPSPGALCAPTSPRKRLQDSHIVKNESAS